MVTLLVTCVVCAGHCPATAQGLDGTSRVRLLAQEEGLSEDQESWCSFSHDVSKMLVTMTAEVNLSSLLLSSRHSPRGGNPSHGYYLRS
jgi:hypothetical protein